MAIQDQVHRQVQRNDEGSTSIQVQRRKLAWNSSGRLFTNIGYAAHDEEFRDTILIDDDGTLMA
jgi:hypothetical protein